MSNNAVMNSSVNPLLEIDTNFYHYVSARSKSHALKSDAHLIGGKLDYAFDGDTDTRQKLSGMFGFNKAMKPVFSYIGERYRLAFGSSAKAGSLKFPVAYEAAVRVSERLGMPLPVVCVLAGSGKYIYSIEGEGSAEPCIVMSAGLAEDTDEELLKFLIGREAGRLQNAHTLYKSAAEVYGVAGKDSDRRETLTDTNMKNTLAEWYRLSDITCDRAGIIALDDPAAYVRVVLRSLSAGFTGIYPEEKITSARINDMYDKIHFTPARSIALGEDVSMLARRLFCGLEFINCEVLYKRRTDAQPLVSHLVNKQAMEVRCVIIAEGGAR